MCTVVFLPTKKGFILSSNRDESSQRGLALAPDKYQEEGLEIVQPKDPLAGGTWFGYNSSGNFIVVLNGAFKRHAFGGTYRKSRGLIVSELLRSSEPLRYWNQMDLMDIEPFTMILYSNDDLFQLVWDGEHKHVLEKDKNHAYIWSSTTLYDKIIQIKRKHLFEDWLENVAEFSVEKLHDFLSSYKDEFNGFIMNRAFMVQTLSMSFMEKSGQRVNLKYIDLVQEKITQLESNLELV